MNCSKFLSSFSSYIEGELDQKILSLFEEHLKQCPRCSRLVVSYRTGINVLPEFPELDVPSDLFARVKDAAVSGKGDTRVIPFKKPLFWVPAAAAAILTVALSMFYLFQTTPERHPFAKIAAMGDSTVAIMDVVNVQMLNWNNYPDKTQPAEEKSSVSGKARLVSFNPEDEVVLSYEVSRNPVIILSGVLQVGE
jgi:hypothetical protein